MFESAGVSDWFRIENFNGVTVVAELIPHADHDKVYENDLPILIGD